MTAAIAYAISNAPPKPLPLAGTAEASTSSTTTSLVQEPTFANGQRAQVIASQRSIAGDSERFELNVTPKGFVQPDGGGKDVFLHVPALERAGLVLLREGDVIITPERHLFDARLTEDFDAAVDAAGNTPSLQLTRGDFLVI